jgi:uncharacterized membrane protein
MTYIVVKWLHVLSSTILFGTGLGSAYFLFCASRTRDPRAVAVVTGHVVLADWLFTATTAVIQPATGLYLVYLAGLALTSKWLLLSLILYAVAIACWLPVVWMQIRMRDIARQAALSGTELPEDYWRYLRRWIALGVVAFGALVVIFWLMVAKPV